METEVGPKGGLLAAAREYGGVLVSGWFGFVVAILGALDWLYEKVAQPAFPSLPLLVTPAWFPGLAIVGGFTWAYLMGLRAYYLLRRRPVPPGDTSPELRRALDAVITWVYRIRNWPGLSSDGRFVEGAPEFYGQGVYDFFDLDARYQRNKHSIPEPGAASPEGVSPLAPPKESGTMELADGVRPTTMPPYTGATITPYRTPRMSIRPSGRHAELVHLRVINNPQTERIDLESVFVRLVLLDSDGVEVARIVARPRDSAGYSATEELSTIPVGATKDFDVALRFLGDENAYLVNSEGFLHFGGSNPAWRVPPGSYALKVTLFHTQGAISGRFALSNALEGTLDLVDWSAASSVGLA